MRMKNDKGEAVYFSPPALGLRFDPSEPVRR